MEGIQVNHLFDERNSTCNYDISGLLEGLYVEQPFNVSFEERPASDSQQAKETTTELVVKYGKLTYTIASVEFLIEKEDGYIYITHPRWSLTGMGRTFLEAEADLLTDAEDVADVYFDFDESELDKEALDMVAFLYSITGYKHVK